MFHNKGEVDDYVLLQTFFCVFCSALLSIPTSQLTLFYSPPFFLVMTLHTSRNLARQSYLALMTLLTFILW